MFKRITAPAQMPVTVPELLEHLRQDDEGQEALLNTLIRTAYQQAEHLTGRPLLQQTWQWSQVGFPQGMAGYFKLKPDTSAITSVMYTDAEGVSQTLAASSYLLVGRRLVPVGQWPVTLPGSVVTIVFDCGYFSDGDDMDCLRSWMKLYAATLYENAEALQPGKQIVLPRTFVDGLLDPYLLIEV